MNRRGLLLLSFLLALVAGGLLPSPVRAQEIIRCTTTVAESLIDTGRSVFYSADPTSSGDGNVTFFWSTGDLAGKGQNADGNIELFRSEPRFNADGSVTPSFTQVTTSTGSILGGFNLAPDVSADGRLVAFFSDRDYETGKNADGNFEIFVAELAVNANGEIASISIRQITNTTQGANLYPTISDNGRWIAFTSENALDPAVTIPNAERNLEVFLADLSPATPIDQRFRQITQTPLGVLNDAPDLSGDGSVMVFSSNQSLSNPEGNLEIYRYVIDSKEMTPVTITPGGTNEMPVVNRDGSRVAFVSDQRLDSTVNIVGGRQVFLSPDLSKVTDFSQIDFSQISNVPGADNFDPNISADGNRVIYQRLDSTGQWVVLFDAVTQSRQVFRSTTNPSSGELGAPVLSGNGTVLFYEDEGGISVVECSLSDFGLAATSDEYTAVAGEPVTYVWTLKNESETIARNVQVQATWPVSFTLSTIEPASCDQATSSCTFDFLGVKESQTITAVVDVAPGAPLGLQTATLSTSSATTADNNLSNNSLPFTTTVSAEADLSIVKSAFPESPLSLGLITYTLAISNAGPSLARSVVVTDFLPEGLLINGNLTFGDPNCRQISTGSRTIRCDIAEIEPDKPVEVTITAQVRALQSALGIALTNRAVVASAGISETDLFTGNNSDIITNTANIQFDLAVGAFAPQRVVAGTPITFTYVVTNIGPSIADRVQLSVTLPAELQTAGVPTIAGATGGNGVCAGGGSLICTLNSLNAGQVVTITVTGNISSTADGSVSSDALVCSLSENTSTCAIGGGDTNQTNDTTSTVTSIDKQAFISALLVGTPTSVAAGTQLTYTLIVTNTGPSAAGNLRISEALHPDVVLQSLQPSIAGVCDPGAPISCTISSLLPGRSVVITATVGVISSTLQSEISNTANVTCNDCIPSNTSRTLVTPVVAESDLTLTMSAAPSSPISGQDDVAYTLRVFNAGPSLARTVILTNTLDPGLSFKGGSSGCAAGLSDPLVVTCSLAPISVGMTQTVSIVASVDADATGPLNANAEVTSSGFDPNAPNKTVATVDAFRTSALIMTKSVTSDNLNVGGLLTYTVIVSNTIPSVAAEVVITDVLPAELILTRPVSTSLGSYNSTTKEWTWEGRDLAPRQSVTMTVVGVLSNAASGRTITNRAVAAWRQDIAPFDQTTSAEVSFGVPLAADLALTKTLVTTSSVKIGETIQYRLQVVNNGPAPATGIIITDTLVPQLGSLAVVSCNDNTSDRSCYSGNRWTVPNLPVGIPATVLLEATLVPESAGDAFDDPTDGMTADQYDYDQTNNTGKISLVVAGADLDLTMDVSDPAPNALDSVVYTITVTNLGPTTAANVRITDTLPISFTSFITQTSSGSFGPAVAGSGSASVWILNSLSVSTTETLVITGVVASGTAGQTITNRIDAATSDVADGDTGNNTPSASFTVQSADLVVSKIVNKVDPVEGDTDLSYTLSISNAGPDDATNVVVTDTLPSGIELRGLPPLDYVSGVWVVGAVNVGDPPKTLTLLVQPILGSSGGKVITNTITGVQADQEDPNPAISASATITVVGADLAVGKSVNDPNPTEGDTIVYTVVVTNTGPYSTTNVVISDTLPAGLTFVSATPSASYNSSTGAWTVGTLNNQQKATLTIRAKVNDVASAGVRITNTATITNTSKLDRNVNGGSDSASVQILVNDKPIANADTAVTDEDTSVTIDVASNDTDSEDSSLTGKPVTLVSGPSHGTATANLPLSGRFTYTPTQNYWGSDVFTYSICDSNNACVTSPVTIAVNPVADTPSVTNATTNEDTGTTSGLKISRNAGDGAEVTHFKITTIQSGTLYQNDRVTVINNNDFITFAQANAGLVFTPTLNFFGAATFNIRASLSNTDGGLGGDPITATITVLSVNDAPVNTLQAVTQSVVDNSTLTFNIANSNAITVADVDGDVLTTTVSVASSGILSVTATGHGASVTTNGTASVRIVGTAVQVNAALVGLRYTPVNIQAGQPNFPVTLTVLTSDGALTDSDNVAITVTNANSAPVNTLQVTTASVADNATLEFRIGNGRAITVADVDGDILTTTVSVASTGTLSVTATGHGAGVTTNGTASVKIVGTTAQVNAALDGLRYKPAGNIQAGQPPVNVTLTVLTTDGAFSDSGTVAIAVTNENSAPVNTLQATTATVADNATLTFNITNSNAITVADVDGDVLTTTVSVTSTGTLSVTATGHGAGVTTNGTASVEIVGTAVQVNAALVGLRYTSAGNIQAGQPNLPVTLTVLTSDGEATGNGTVEITVTNANTAPVNTLQATTASVADNATLTFNITNSNAITVADVDGDVLTTTVSVASTGTLSVTATGHGAGVTTNGTASVKIVGTAAQVNAALDGLRYTPAGNIQAGQPDLSVTLTVLTSDGALSDSDSVAITVTNENSAPVNTLQATTVTVADNATLTFNITNSNAISVGDVDGDVLTTTVSVASSGILSVTATGHGAGVTTNGTASVKIVGTPAQVSAALVGLAYSPANIPAGQADVNVTLTVLTSDGTLTDSDSVAIAVTNANSAPVAVDDSVSTNQNASISIPVLANDTDVDFDSLVIIDKGTPLSGTVSISPPGITWTLVYTPDLNVFGTDTFTYTISDGELTSTAQVSVEILALPDLIISKSDGKDAASNNEALRYTIRYTNTGNAPTDLIVITETVPLYTQFDLASSSPGWDCADNALPNTTCVITPTISVLAPTETGIVTFTVDMRTGVNKPPNGSIITNTVLIGDVGGLPELSVDNNSAQDTTVVTVPDLVITKQSSPGVAVPGGLITYTINYTNTGSQKATNVLLTEVVPISTTYVSGGWTCANGGAPGATCTQAVSDVNNTGGTSSGNLSFVVQVDNPIGADISTITNTVEIDGAPGDANPDDNIYTTTTTINASPVLTISKRGPSSAVAGQLITYTLTVTNTGNRIANGLVITDALPAGSTFVQASDGGVKVGSIVSWTLASLTTNTPVTRTFAVTATTTITNSAYRVSGVSASGVTSATGAVSVTTTAAKLTLSKSVSSGSVTAGGPITYTVRITNSGSAVTSNVRLTDTLPLTVSLVTSSTTPGLTCAGTTTITCSQASLGVGNSAVLTITGAVSATAGSGTSIVNSVTATSVDVTTPVIAQASTTVQRSVALTITKTAFPSTVLAGAQITYTVRITNDGPSLATNLVVTDNLPISVSLVTSSTGGLMTCGGTSNLTCNLPSLGVNNSVTWTITGTVSASAPNGVPITNTAGVTAAEASAAQVAQVATAVQRSAALTITKTAFPSTVLAGAQITYTVHITNDGPSLATNLVVTDNLPISVSLVTSSTGGLMTCGGTSNLTCNLPSLGVNSSVTWTITGTVSASAPNGVPITNTAGVTAAEASAAQVAQVATAVNTVADLQITQSVVTTGTPVVGSVVTYTLSITNSGPSYARAVYITDSLPISVAYGSMIGMTPAGFFSMPVTTTNTVTWMTDTLPTGSGLITFTGTVTGSGTALSNSVTITSTTTDSAPGNNNAANASFNAAGLAMAASVADLWLRAESTSAAIAVDTPAEFVFRAGNRGPRTVEDATVTIQSSADVVGRLLTEPSVTCPRTDGRIICSLPVLLPGDGVGIGVTIPTAQSGSFVSAWTIEGALFDPNPDDNLVEYRWIVGDGDWRFFLPFLQSQVDAERNKAEENHIYMPAVAGP